MDTGSCGFAFTGSDGMTLISTGLYDKPAPPSAVLIREVCRDLADFLVEKNEAYGDSALHPVRIFSKADAAEQIKVRMDDKINRMIQGREYAGDDTMKDLVGYWVLLEVSKRLSHADHPNP